jgi:hypothetical protein
MRRLVIIKHTYVLYIYKYTHTHLL